MHLMGDAALNNWKLINNKKNQHKVRNGSPIMYKLNKTTKSIKKI